MRRRRDRGSGTIYKPNKNSSIWWFSYWVRGERIAESSKSKNRTDAVKLLQKRLAEIASGKPTGPQVDKTSFEDLAKILIADYEKNRRRSTKRVQRAIENLREFFGDYQATQITSDRISAYEVSRQREGAANATINRELSALKRMFRLGRTARRVAEAPEISMLQEDNARKGFFDRDQFEAVTANLPEDIKPVVEVAYITGWRVASEILTREWKHVDFGSRFLRLEPGETKNRKGRMFAMTPRLKGVLERQRERTTAIEKATGQIIPWVFHREGKPIRRFDRSWKTACRKAGVPGKLRHDFRRTAVRNLERAGVARSAAKAMVGHLTDSIYNRYAIADEAMLHEGAEKLSVLHERERAIPNEGSFLSSLTRSADAKLKLSSNPSEPVLRPRKEIVCFEGINWCRGTESNRRRKDFQSFALPTELPRHPREAPILAEGVKKSRRTHAPASILPRPDEISGWWAAAPRPWPSRACPCRRSRHSRRAR